MVEEEPYKVEFDALNCGTRSPPRSPVRSQAREISLETDALIEIVPHAKTKGLFESIYGSAMAAIIQSAADSTPCAGSQLSGMTMIIYGYLIANVAFQSYLLHAMKNYICAPTIAKIRRIYRDFRHATHENDVFSVQLWNAWDHDEKSELCQVPLSQPVLFMVLLFIWTSYMLVDIRQTAFYANAWLSLPYPEDVGCKAEVKVRRTEDAIITEAASRKVKVRVFVMILLPKAAIAAVLWWLGARWLTATPSFENLLLNAAALAFVTEVDEIMYAALAADDVKEATMSTHLLVPLQGGEYRALWRSIFSMISWTLVNVSVPLVFVSYIQTVIPHYKWDLSHPCASWFEDLDANDTE